MQKRKLILFLIAAAGMIAVVLTAATKYSIPYDSDNVFYHSDEYFMQSGIRLTIPDSEPVVSDTVIPEYERVDINNATVWELAAKLPGIGEKKAQAIVEYREMSGGFRSVDELIEVEGIGEKTVEKIRPYCYV